MPEKPPNPFFGLGAPQANSGKHTPMSCLAQRPKLCKYIHNPTRINDSIDKNPCPSKMLLPVNKKFHIQQKR